MNATALERRISTLVHGSREEMRRIVSVLGFKLRYLLSRRATGSRAAKKAKPSPQSKRLDIRDLRGFGGIRSDYDYKAMRTEGTRRS